MHMIHLCILIGPLSVFVSVTVSPSLPPSLPPSLTRTQSSSDVDPEILFTRQERIGKGSFGEVYKG